LENEANSSGYLQTGKESFSLRMSAADFLATYKGQYRGMSLTSGTSYGGMNDRKDLYAGVTVKHKHFIFRSLRGSGVSN
jgi:hypothetical protein